MTQNLVTSADFAQWAKPDWASIQDLAVLIDIFCMYDSAVVLGRALNHCLNSNVGQLLTTSGFMRIEEPTGENEKIISDSAKRHLLAFIGGDGDPERFDSLLKYGLSPDAVGYGLRHTPDGREDVELGETWLKTAPSKEDVLTQLQREQHATRGTTFVVRSFLYAAYSDVSGLILVPDSARTPVLQNIVSSEQQLRDKLLEKIRAASGAVQMSTDVRLNRVSPLAAVVFERAKPDKKRIAAEMDLLRAELAPLRRRLRGAEDKIFSGKGTEVTDAVNDWDLVVDELGRRFGREPHLISLDGILRFGRDAAEVADSVSKPKAWMAALLGLPFDVLRRIVARRPAIELHTLQREIPGSGRLKRVLLELFGSDIRA